MRHTMKSNHGFDLTNIIEQYITNHDYDAQDKRCIYEQKQQNQRKIDSSENNTVMSQNHRPIWHNKSKQQQLMEGDELLILGKQYLSESITREIPREV